VARQFLTWPPFPFQNKWSVENRVRISWGIHGLPKVLLGLAMPYHSTPCWWPPLKQPHSCFKGAKTASHLFQEWPPQGGRPGAVSKSPWIPHAIRAYRKADSHWLNAGVQYCSGGVTSSRPHYRLKQLHLRINPVFG
jgi:hypothetical protein